MTTTITAEQARGLGISNLETLARGGFVNPPKPADSVSISLEFLRGVEASAQYAHDNYEDTDGGEISDTVIATEVARLREEATK